MYIPTVNSIVGFDVDKFLNDKNSSEMPAQTIGTLETGKDILELSSSQNEQKQVDKLKIFATTFMGILFSVLAVLALKKVIKKNGAKKMLTAPK